MRYMVVKPPPVVHVYVLNEAGIEHARVYMKVSDVVPGPFNSYMASLYVPTNWL